MGILETDEEIASLLRSARTIAIVGLSGNPARDSHRVARYLLDHGYAILPVNPTVEEVLGIRSYPDLAAIGRSVDIVDVFRRPEFMPAIADAAVRGGAGSLWMQFDTCDSGAAASAAASGMKVVADRCIMVEHRRLVA